VPADPDTADVPDDPDDPRPVTVAEWEVVSEADEVFALDTLVDLAGETAPASRGPIHFGAAGAYRHQGGDGAADTTVSAATTPTMLLAIGDSWPSW